MEADPIGSGDSRGGRGLGVHTEENILGAVTKDFGRGDNHDSNDGGCPMGGRGLGILQSRSGSCWLVSDRLVLIE